MPSLLIHLAIAKRYTELHPNEISNMKDFEKGSIAPDLSDDFSRILSEMEKATSHYRIRPDDDAVDFNKFKNDKNVDLTNDYWKGYCLHLITDHLFYKSVFEQEYQQSLKDEIYLYDDYEVLASQIIKDYHPTLNAEYTTDIIKRCLSTKDGECKYLNYTKLHEFIEKVSDTHNSWQPYLETPKPNNSPPCP